MWLRRARRPTGTLNRGGAVGPKGRAKGVGASREVLSLSDAITIAFLIYLSTYLYAEQISTRGLHNLVSATLACPRCPSVGQAPLRLCLLFVEARPVFWRAELRKHDGGAADATNGDPPDGRPTLDVVNAQAIQLGVVGRGDDDLVSHRGGAGHPPTRRGHGRRLHRRAHQHRVGVRLDVVAVSRRGGVKRQRQRRPTTDVLDSANLHKKENAGRGQKHMPNPSEYVPKQRNKHKTSCQAKQNKQCKCYYSPFYDK